MGKKITVDSATLMNKGLEIIEASWLFDVTADEIDVVIHRESIVHSLIELADNSVLAQMGVPDMGIPIQYALTYPRRETSEVKPLSLVKCGSLSFFEPDYQTFKCLSACMAVHRKGGLLPAVANGANEEAVKLFLEKRISFLGIGEIVTETISRFGKSGTLTLDTILEADKAARIMADECSVQYRS